VLMPEGYEKYFLSLVEGGLALSAAYLAIGLLAADRGWPAIAQAMLPWGAWVFGLLLCVEIAIVLEKSYTAHAVAPLVYPAYGAALLALAALALLPRESDRGRLVILAACAVGLTIPLMFAGIASADLLRRVLISVAVFVSAVGLIAGGLLVGLTTLIAAGYAVFGLSILILLWQTIGTLLSQSLFFLIIGVALLALAAGAHRLANWSRPGSEASSGSAA